MNGQLPDTDLSEQEDTQNIDTSTLDRDFVAPLPGDPEFIGPIQQQ